MNYLILDRLPPDLKAWALQIAKDKRVKDERGKNERVKRVVHNSTTPQST